MRVQDPRTEADWMGAVGGLLDYHGWRWYHPEPKKRSRSRWTVNTAAGIPDLICVKPPRVVWLEVKTESGRIRPEQVEWIEELRQSGQEVHIIRLPGDYGFLDDLLRPDSRQLTLTGNSTGATWTQSP